MAIVEANGISIYHEIHGPTAIDASNRPVRVLNISGTGSDLRYAAPERSPLNKVFEVLHYDQRGLGQTSKPGADEDPSTYEMVDYARDAAALIRAVGWERCHVVGTSFGGMVAQHLAIRHPEVVDRLVLNCTSPGGTLPSFPCTRSNHSTSRPSSSSGSACSTTGGTQDDPIPSLASDRSTTP